MPNHPRTEADLVRFRASVRIECRDCGSVVTYGPEDFARDCGIGSLGGIAKHMACASCGAKRAQLLVQPPGPMPLDRPAAL